MDGLNPFLEFVAIHRPQLEASAVPQHLWQSLYRKLTMENFDAAEAFQLLLVDYDSDEDDEDADSALARPVFILQCCRENGIKAADPNSIFLIDHAVTYRLPSLRQLLEQYPNVTIRLSAICGVNEPENTDKLMQRMWKYCQTYTIANPSGGDGADDADRTPIWYIMDEVGSAVTHAEQPNSRIVPFLYQNMQTTYSLLFPIQDLECDDQVTRDWLEFVAKDAPERDALLLPWVYKDLSKGDFRQQEPDADYFLSGHVAESYPTEDSSMPQLNRTDPLKVYAEYDVVRQFLTDDAFTLTDNEAEADILWLTTHFKNFAELATDTPNRFINQFPFEYVLTIKDLLSITCRRAAQEHHNTETLETYPSWLPTTFNLKTEVEQFAAYYQQRQAKNLDNHWIIKPWNLARGLDMHITNNIVQIMRLPSTGPKIAQKYIERPVLFYRPELDAKVKFDVRYVILLKSVQPLEAYVHRKFFLRFANSAFSLDHFDNYEKHFTVMNYNENAQLHHIKCEDFVGHWQEQYPKNSWTDVENGICKMLHEMLVCATKVAPPRGIAPCQQSRALYAADIMLEWVGDEESGNVQPKLLEVNWTPDCQRACDYYPEFFNDIFKLLFLNDVNDEEFRLLAAE